jgi:hypothetical protein
MTRVPAPTTTLRFPPDSRRTICVDSLADFPLRVTPADWLWTARHLAAHTTIVVSIAPGEVTEAACISLGWIGQILAGFGHQLLIDEEREPLKEATTL